MLILVLLGLALGDTYNEWLSIAPLGDTYVFSHFEFNYTMRWDESLLKYIPSDLISMIREVEFEKIKLDFGMGRWNY